MNPVWKRELRARWRGWRAFALVFFYVAVLGIIFVWQYGDNLSQQQQYQEYQTFDPNRRMSLLGHNLFVLLAWLQTVLWMLLAPILTATAITSEREQGLLEGLHLSHLRPIEIVLGKLGSALSLITLLILITLPIVATCFLMGGVSPGEFLLVSGLHAATAICCATIGLAVSAWCKNGMAAIALAIVAVLTWIGLAYASVVLALAGVSPWGTPPWPWNQLLELFTKGHPITAIAEVVQTSSTGRGLPWTITTPTWIVTLVFLLGFTIFNLWIAAKGTRRLLDNRGRLEWQRLRRDLKTPDVTNLDIAPRAPTTPVGGAPALKTKRFELGFLSRLHFSNPVLGREARACFRPRSTSLAMLLVAVILLPMAVLAYAQGLYWAIFDSQMRVVIGPSLLVIFLIMAIGLGGVLGAGALAREREGGTWEALRLSLLSPGEILWGKLGTPLLMCGVTGAVFLPVLLMCVRSLEYSGNAKMPGISLSQLLNALIVIAPMAWFCSLLGLACSHFSKKSVTAICWTLGLLFVVLVVAPLFYAQVGTYDEQRLFTQWLKQWHPVLLVISLFDFDANPNQKTAVSALPCALLLVVACVGLHFFMLREMYAARRASNT